jgi:ABC transporter substrate binding protein (PQQ-dependent alcohol dehydrogenase system)
LSLSITRSAAGTFVRTAALFLAVAMLAGSATAEPTDESTAQTAAPAQSTDTGAASDTSAPAAPKAAPTAPEATPPGATPGSIAPSAEEKIKATIPIYYLGKKYDEPLPLSVVEPIITDKGIQGARLAIEDANRVAPFTGYKYNLVEDIIPKKGDIVAKAKEILAKGDAFIVADLEPDDLIAVADLPEAKNSVLLNIRSSAEKLRQEDCRQNVFHIIPDYAMRADALGQYLIWKKWPRWFVLRGDTKGDKDYLAQLERTAKRYGGKIVKESVYPFPPGARNLTSGYQQVQGQIPQATEAAPDHDVLWVIDTNDDFGDYLMYRTYSPRPVVGTQGLKAEAWDPAYTESGANRLHSDFKKKVKRDMTERDYTGWLGVRTITDSVMRSGKTTPPGVKGFMLSKNFNLEGYKRIALNFRPWDHQMRQPIILGGTRVPVSTSPQEGFLHPTYTTDTLGYDKPETKCKFK